MFICLFFVSDIPYSRGNITFSILTPEPNLRLGYNDFYNSAALQEFVRATHVRIQLHGQYHTQDATVPFRYRYYAVDEITISGRSVTSSTQHPLTPSPDTISLLHPMINAPDNKSDTNLWTVLIGFPCLMRKSVGVYGRIIQIIQKGKTFQVQDQMDMADT